MIDRRSSSVDRGLIVRKSFRQSLSNSSDKMQRFVLLSSTTISFALMLFFIFTGQRDKTVSAQLTGDTETCENEGKRVDITDIRKAACFDCTCKDGIVQCEMLVCPNADSCYKLREIQKKECCPECKGKQQLHNVTTNEVEMPSHSENQNILEILKKKASKPLSDTTKGGCQVGGRLYEAGARFRMDDCTHCSCVNSTVFCEKEHCPALRCKQDRQEAVPGQCCPRCLNEEVNVNDPHLGDMREIELTCSYAGKTYKDGDTWNTAQCESCSCKKGNINCTAVMCPTLKCPSDSIMKIPDGQCCPVCEETPGMCTVFGGSHFRTFDRKLYSFLGSCKYLLSRDCDGNDFTIRIANSVHGNDARTRRVFLRLGNLRIDLQQNNHNTKVNDRVVDLPYRTRSLEIGGTREAVTVSAPDSGIRLRWNYVGLLELTVPRSFRSKLCGLCGNFNASPDDDLTTREDILVEDPVTFAQSWTSGDEECLETRRYGLKGCNPRRDQRLCSYIKGSIFEKCLKRIVVKPYYDKCLKDMCECYRDDNYCHCESFSSYVRDCQGLGILLPDWQKAVGCYHAT